MGSPSPTRHDEKANHVKALYQQARTFILYPLAVLALGGCKDLIITTNAGDLGDQEIDSSLPEVVGDASERCPVDYVAKAAPVSTATPIPDRYIVVLNDGAASSSVPMAKGSAGLTYSHALNGFVGTMSAAEADRLAADPRVKYVEPDYHVKLDTRDHVVTSSVGQVEPWGVAAVGGSRDGSGHTAWIVDTGIDLDNPDLNVDRARSRNIIPDGRGSAMDGNGHGTHVAGTIGARDNGIGVVGVAANARLVAVRVLDDTGSGDYSTIIAGIDYVTANARSGDVMNLSLGGPTSRALDDAVRRAASHGIKVVIAAGNDGENASAISPARVNYSGVYTVSAIDRYGSLARFSNFGPSVDVAAPGVGVVSTAIGGGTVTMSGTSMAAPHVAGLLLFGSVHTKESASLDPDGCADPIAYR
jgi:subtilisin family serine protease